MNTARTQHGAYEQDNSASYRRDWLVDYKHESDLTGLMTLALSLFCVATVAFGVTFGTVHPILAKLLDILLKVTHG
jgi:hypothetical protein